MELASMKTKPKTGLRRAYIEIADGNFVMVERLHECPDHIVQAHEVLRRQLHDTLDRLAPVFGRDVLMKLCREAMRK